MKSTPFGDPPSIEMENLRIAGENGVFLLSSPCRVGCRYCCEHHLPRIFPTVDLHRIPAYSEASFAHWRSALEGSNRPALPLAPCWVEGGRVQHSAFTDFFAQGLTEAQIESFVAYNAERGASPLLATTGQELTPELAARLSHRYPDSFRLHLSILTFRDSIRRHLYSRPAYEPHLTELLRVLRSPKIYLVHFDHDQILSDLAHIDLHSDPENRAAVVIARLHSHRHHPEEIQELARKSGSGFEDLIEQLARLRPRLGNIEELYFHYPAEAFAWNYRDAIRQSLLPFEPGDGDLVLCSTAAYETLRSRELTGGADVFPVSDALQGTTTFATALGNRELIARIEQLTGERSYRRVLLPSSIWWIGEGHSLDGGTFDQLREHFTELDLQVVEISNEVLQARLTLEQCLAYYRARRPS